MVGIARSRFKGWSVVHRTTDNLDWPGWAVTGDGPLADGLGCVTRLQIAEQLGLSPHTVGTLTRRVYRKLGARNRAQMVRAPRA